MHRAHQTCQGLNGVYGQELEWRGLLCDAHELTELTWNQMNGVQPTLDPLSLYDQACSVRTRWLNYLNAHFASAVEETPTSEETVQQTGVLHECQLLEQLVVYVKELVSLTPV